MFQVMTQKKTAHISQIRLRTTPQYKENSNMYPTIMGDGKSPSKCMKKIATALACPLSSFGTEFINDIATGPLLLFIPYKKIKKCATLTPVINHVKVFR